MVELTCESCGEGYLVKPYKVGQSRFCSTACKAESQRRTVTIACSWCATEFERRVCQVDRYGSGRSFCSKSCHQAWRTANPRRIRFGGAIREHERAHYGTACALCPWDRGVEYAHVTAAAHGGTIHPDNIIPLCPNHHLVYDNGTWTDEEFEIIADYLIRAWGSPHSLRPEKARATIGNGE